MWCPLLLLPGPFHVDLEAPGLGRQKPEHGPGREGRASYSGAGSTRGSWLSASGSLGGSGSTRGGWLPQGPCLSTGNQNGQGGCLVIWGGGAQFFSPCKFSIKFISKRTQFSRLSHVQSCAAITF